MDAKLALQYVEIDVDYCSLTYGVAPCTASIPTTGDAKCFNTKNTCQDTANFTNVPVTLRFGVDTDFLPREIECFPSIKPDGITFDAATISLGENLGQRATLTVVFIDHRHSDTGEGFDKYLADRAYNPFEQGTFFGKFRARQPFLRGRPLRWITGFVGDDLADMTTHNFVIESFAGPKPDGSYSLVAKDILKLADGDRAMAPRASNGYLSADINSSTTSAALSPSGIGDTEYPASGYLNLGGREIVSFTRTADALTIARAQLGSTASSHSAQDRAQIVLRYTSQSPADIIADLLETYASVNSDFVPLTDWQDECDTFLDNLYTAIIANPTSVNTLISELIQQAALALWWSDEAEVIRLQVLRGIDTSAVLLSENVVRESSLIIDEQPDKRLSQVLTYFGQINPLTSLTDTSNYRSSELTVDDDAEGNYGSAAIKTIYSRWIPAGGRAVATRLNELLLARYRDPPRKCKLELLRDSVDPAPELGQGFRLEAWPIQDADGASAQAAMEVTRLNPGPAIISIEAEEMLFLAPPDTGSRTVVFDFSTNNVNFRTSYDLLYSTPQSGDVVTAIVNSGVIIGSTSTGSPAFDVGTWPVGVSLILDIRGRIQGKGGAGGRGGNRSSAGVAGGTGGTALYTRTDIDLIISSGSIWGGGGGGGGGGSVVHGADCVSGGGGGAGQGQQAGNPGASGGEDYPATNGGGATSETIGAAGLAAQAVFGILFGGNGGAGGSEGGAGITGNAATGDVGDTIFSPGAGGAAGNAIDGDTFVTVTAGPGDIQGPRIN